MKKIFGLFGVLAIACLVAAASAFGSMLGVKLKCATCNSPTDPRNPGEEAMISVERELDGVESDGVPFRNESYPYLALRVERSYKANSWAENPPARTRRIVGNVEITAVAGDRLSVVSVFHPHWSRPGSASYLYAGQRRDTLQRAEGRAPGDLRILRREVVLDMADIEFPTLGLFL